MEESELHFRHLMLFYFQKGKNAVQTAKNACTIYEDGAITENMVCK